MGVVGEQTLRPVMLVRRPVAMAVAAFRPEDLHRRVAAICGATGEPVALSLERGKPSRRWVGTATMRPGMPDLPQNAGQEHEGRKQRPDTAGGRFRHRAPPSIHAPRLSITDRPPKGNRLNASGIPARA